MPDEEAVDGAEGEFAPFGALPGAVHVVEDPGGFGAREIGVQLESGGGSDAAGFSRMAQFITDGGGTPVLPDDRVVDGLAGGAVPDHGGLALVGDANRSDVRH